MSDNPSPSRNLEESAWDHEPSPANLPPLSLSCGDLPPTGSPVSENSQPSSSSDSLLSAVNLDSSSLTEVVPDSTSDLLNHEPESTSNLSHLKSQISHFLPLAEDSTGPLDHGQMISVKSLSSLVGDEDHASEIGIVLESPDATYHHHHHHHHHHTSSLIIPDSSASYEPVVTTTRTLDQSSSLFEPSPGAGLPPVSTIIRHRNLVEGPFHQGLSLSVMVHKSADSLSLAASDDSSLLTSSNTSLLDSSSLCCDPATSLTIHQVVSNVPISDSFGAPLLTADSSSSPLDEPHSTSLGPPPKDTISSLLQTEAALVSGTSNLSTDSQDKLMVGFLESAEDTKGDSPLCNNLCSNLAHNSPTDLSPILPPKQHQPEEIDSKNRIKSINAKDVLSTSHIRSSNQESACKLELKQMIAQAGSQTSDAIKFSSLLEEAKKKSPFIGSSSNSFLVKTAIEEATNHQSLSELSNNVKNLISNANTFCKESVARSSTEPTKAETSVIQNILSSRQTSVVQTNPASKRSVIAENFATVITKPSRGLDAKLGGEDVNVRIKIIKKNGSSSHHSSEHSSSFLKTPSLMTSPIPALSSLLLPGILTSSLSNSIKQEASSTFYSGFSNSLPPLIKHEGTGPLPPFTVVSGLVKQEIPTSFAGSLLSASLAPPITIKQEPGTFRLPSIASIASLKQVETTSSGSIPFSSASIVTTSEKAKLPAEESNSTKLAAEKLEKQKSCVICKLGSPCGLHPLQGSSPQGPLMSGDPSKPFQCNLCGKHLATRNVYHLHMRSHSGEKPFKCNLCGHHFSQKTSLTRHMRSHTGERPFPCEVCGKRFADKERIKIHMRTHTGEKPFACELCGKKFSQKSTVKRHMSVHTGEKPFKCTTCGKGFANRGNLNAHSKTHESPTSSSTTTTTSNNTTTTTTTTTTSTS